MPGALVAGPRSRESASPICRPRSLPQPLCLARLYPASCRSPLSIRWTTTSSRAPGL